MFSTLNRLLHERPYILAVLILLFLVLWFVSGGNPQKDHAAIVSEVKSQAPPVRVEVRRFTTTPIPRRLVLYGYSEPARVTVLRSEIGSEVVAILKKKGQRVHKNELLLRLALDTRPQDLMRAEAELTLRTLEYQGAQKLARQGYQGKIHLATVKVALKQAEADVSRLRLALSDTAIRAPYSGILSRTEVELGSVVQKGEKLGELIDIDPLIVRADVSERDIHKLSAEQHAQLRFVDGEKATGVVRYIVSYADPATHLFRIEIAIPNPDLKLKAGMSAEVILELAKVEAIQISAALLTLNDTGDVGIKTVVDGRVYFIPIELVQADDKGVWVQGEGLQGHLNIITVGQGFVRAGARVEAVDAGVTP